MDFSRHAAAWLAASITAVFAQAQSSIAPGVERASRSLAHVSVLFEGGNAGVVRVERSSSGFVIDPHGLLLTNEHLVDEIPTGGGAPGAEYWLAVVLEGREPCGAKVVARDERLDLALLQLELEPGEVLLAQELAPDTAPAPGTDAFALGRPRGGELFALAGSVSKPCGPLALRAGQLETGEALITDAAVLDDVDGGPFVDRRGRALGIMNTVQHLAYDPKAKDDKIARNPIDYGVVVSASAIRHAFSDRIAAAKTPSTSPAAEDEDAAIVRTGASSVVSLWRGSEETRPTRSEPNDPYAEKPRKGLGSGVIVDPSGLVLTSSDVVAAATELGVRLSDGREFRGKVLRLLAEKNVALVQLSLPEGVAVPAIELGSSDDALAGETIAVIGNPYGDTPTVSTGVLSALEVEERLRIGAWVHDGHRGGALLDSNGRLIGIPVADIFEGRERERGESYLGVALPIDRVRSWLAAEFEQHGSAPGLRTAPASDAQERARRKNKVTSIVAATRDSLVNVEIKAEAEKSEAFDPFATPGESRLYAQGSGVVIDASGLAITNWHVVHPTLADDGTQRSDYAVEVTTPSGKRYKARVLAASRDDDLALIQLELPSGEAVNAVPLGASRTLRRGDVVVAIGNPYGKANTVTVGIIVAKDQTVNIAGRLHPYENLLQTDAAINPGNSGGALLDIEGRLVGINSAGRSGVGLAIPVERVREVFGQKLLSTMGPFLGLTLDDAPGEGLLVSAVDDHGPAEKAGVAQGDKLRAVDGHVVASTVDYGNALLALRSKLTVRVDLERKGERIATEIHPVTQTSWRLFRQTGIEVSEVDYGAEAELVRTASIALHRAYTGLSDGEPSRLMASALRVVQAVPLDARALDVKVGDILLGASSLVRTVDTEHASLVRFESVNVLRDFVEPLATKEGNVAECWLMREGKVIKVRVPVLKAR